LIQYAHKFPFCSLTKQHNLRALYLKKNFHFYFSSTINHLFSILKSARIHESHITLIKRLRTKRMIVKMQKKRFMLLFLLYTYSITKNELIPFLCFLFFARENFFFKNLFLFLEVKKILFWSHDNQSLREISVCRLEIARMRKSTMRHIRGKKVLSSCLLPCIFLSSD
jgi:hypothetical protein